MKKVLYVLAFVLVGLVGATSAEAQEANGYDGKSYTGTFCQPYSAGSHTLSANNGYFASAAHLVTCPILKDNWAVVSGLSYAYVRLYNPAGKTTACTLSSVDYNGTVVTSTTKSTTIAGNQTVYMSPYPSPNASEGSYVLICDVPQGGAIKRYAVQEKP